MSGQKNAKTHTIQKNKGFALLLLSQMMVNMDMMVNCFSRFTTEVEGALQEYTELS